MIQKLVGQSVWYASTSPAQASASASEAAEDINIFKQKYPFAFQTAASDSAAAEHSAVAKTVNVPAAPTVNVVLFALVNAGAWSTVSVKFCTALAPTPFEAVNVMW